MPDPVDPVAPAPRASPLHAVHKALGASFTDFGGWLMPVRYTSDLAEHHAVRRAAGLFDISHMAEFVVTGPDAAPFLGHALAGPLAALAVGRAKYTLLLNESGGILDDLIVYRLAADRYLVIANAGNRAVVAEALEDRAQRWPTVATLAGGDRPAGGSFALVRGSRPVRVDDVSDSYALLALQGPRSSQILSAVRGLEATGADPAALSSYAWAEASFDGVPVLVLRTGYTGEDGYELLLPADRAAGLWAALQEAGEGLGLIPAGLAARDTLRLEAGMPLYGHELSADVRPGQVGLARVVGSGASGPPGFVGGDALARPRDAGAPVLVGLVSEGRRAARSGYPVRLGDSVVGNVTSGALSPTLGHPIAMAFVRPDLAAPGTALDLDVRGTRIPATVTALPFYRRKK
ncbi:aminomethyltransferase family protein [Microbacterium sp. NPDC078428]|uniref:aminomethyltransferase family protein n=1 Tax=Microbacterium sp. NPDC078428 TaxID=3364190 RepID=UPI0037C746D0